MIYFTLSMILYNYVFYKKLSWKWSGISEKVIRDLISFTIRNMATKKVIGQSWSYLHLPLQRYLWVDQQRICQQFPKSSDFFQGPEPELVWISIGFLVRLKKNKFRTLEIRIKFGNGRWFYLLLHYLPKLSTCLKIRNM